MIQTEKKEKIIKYKFIYTVLILLVYLVGKRIPLYGIDIASYMDRSFLSEHILLQTVSGDINQCSLFALGISPYMISTIIVQIMAACRSLESKQRTSPRKLNRIALMLTLIVTIFQAFFHVQKLQFTPMDSVLFLTKAIAGLEMVAGVMVILWLSARNKKYGIGGQTTLIFVNILEGILTTVKGREVRELIIPVIISVIVMIIVIIMENAEVRIPVQRISIHNIYADKNYLAIKLNPIGVMPAMFSTAFFMVPQLIITGLALLFPENSYVSWWQDNVTLSKPLGIVVYILILYCLTVGFSRVFVNPKEITEQFLKSGDSILNLHAGRDTKRYLSGVITRISLLSATVMSVCLGVPIVLQLVTNIDSKLIMLPSLVMMLTGIWCNLYREVVAIRNLEAYRPFI